MSCIISSSAFREYALRALQFCGGEGRGPMLNTAFECVVTWYSFSENGAKIDAAETHFEPLAP